MTVKTLIAVAVAAAFAMPWTVQAGGGKASGGASASGGAEAMFKSLDKNKDGSLSRDEVKGSPHARDFSSLDKDGDGKLSRDEHAAAPEHAGDKGGAASPPTEGKTPKY
jgi:hypothetical protein